MKSDGSLALLVSFLLRTLFSSSAPQTSTAPLALSTLSHPPQNKCCLRQHQEAQTWASNYGNWPKSHGDHLLTCHIPSAHPQSFISFCFSFRRLSKANTVIPVCTETHIMGPWSWFELRIINANMNLAALILNLIQFWIFPTDKAFPELHHKHPWVAAQGWALEMSQRPASPDANMFLTVVTPLCIQGLFATVHFKVKFYSFSCLEAPLLLVGRNWNIK